MNVFDKIRNWAKDVNLIDGSTQHAQLVKTMEELGELAAAVARDDRLEFIDSIGDVVVCLTILAAQNCINIEQCIAAAYEVIKDRKGKMVDGVFIKEGLK